MVHSAPPTQNARLSAYRALEAFQAGRLEFLEDASFPEDPREAALARELCLGVVRHQSLYDHLADRFLRPGPQPIALRLVLRLAAHQLFACDRIPPHAVGSTGVELLRLVGQPHLVGIANAVIRRLAGLRLAERPPNLDGPLGRLAVPVSDPGLRHGLGAELLADLGRRSEAELAALNRMPPLCTRTRPGRQIPDDPTILRREDRWTWWSEPRVALAAVGQGLAVVQDRTQGEAVLLAAPKAGEKALDLCAAPGGKALFLQDLGVQILAADRTPAKVAQLAALGLPCLIQDGLHPKVGREFDLVVVDAPCSGTGVLGRKPEARLRYHRRNQQRLIALQQALLSSGAQLVRSGGRLLYATCSVMEPENHQVAASLAGWRILVEQSTWPGDWCTGGYAAVLVQDR